MAMKQSNSESVGSKSLLHTRHSHKLLMLSIHNTEICSMASKTCDTEFQDLRTSSSFFAGNRWASSAFSAPSITADRRLSISLCGVNWRTHVSISGFPSLTR